MLPKLWQKYGLNEMLGSFFGGGKLSRVSAPNEYGPEPRSATGQPDQKNAHPNRNGAGPA